MRQTRPFSRRPSGGAAEIAIESRMGAPKMKSLALLPITAIFLVAGAVHAQQQIASSYPDHVVRIIVPFPAGGAADILPRIVADGLRQRWHQSIILENRAGAGGNVGASVVAAADPDGYTLLA